MGSVTHSSSAAGSGGGWASLIMARSYKNRFSLARRSPRPSTNSRVRSVPIAFAKLLLVTEYPLLAESWSLVSDAGYAVARVLSIVRSALASFADHHARIWSPVGRGSNGPRADSPAAVMP